MSDFTLSRTPSPGPSSSHGVIPPIVKNEKDREFLRELISYINKETGKVDPSNAEQRYIVHRSAFDKIIDYVTAYKPLLTAIKAEYEECIEAIQRGQREAFFLQGKINAMAQEPSTVRNYRKRTEELDHKLSIIQEDNERLQAELDTLRAARAERERKAKEIAEPTHRSIKKDHRAIPGLTLEQSTDLKVLTKELEKLEKQFRELSISYRTRYSSKDFKEGLKHQLSHKVDTRDHLVDETTLLKAKRQKLMIAVEAANAYNKLQPPHQTIGDAVVMALAKAGPIIISGGPEEGVPRGISSSTTVEEDDPSKEKEAEQMLEYIEKFNELLEDQKYEEAAIHAANSPKGILRTPETLHRFKDLKNVYTPNGRSPLLAYSEALMSTVMAFGMPPTEYMSYECVKCALEENRLDLISHWISQDRLSVSEKLGTLIYEHCKRRRLCTGSCLSMAQHIFVKIGSHHKAVESMVRQGRITQALDYGYQTARFKPQDYITVLYKAPSAKFANALFKRMHAGKPLVPLGVVVRTMMETDGYDAGLRLLQDVQLSGSQDPRDPSSPVRRAVFDDDQTTKEQWLDIIRACQDNGYEDVALELLAAVTVLNVMNSASENIRQYIHDNINETETKAENEQENNEMNGNINQEGDQDENDILSNSDDTKDAASEALEQKSVNFADPEIALSDDEI